MFIYFKLMSNSYRDALTIIHNNIAIHSMNHRGLKSRIRNTLGDHDAITE